MHLHPEEATSMPMSVENAFAMGVSSEARSCAARRAASVSACSDASIAPAVAKQITRAARVSARMESNMRFTSGCAMITFDPSFAPMARPCLLSRA
jgi:hypothetical protein